MKGTSLEITQDILDKLKDIMPSVFSEGKINFDKLKAVLGENIYSGNERYELSWAGKSDAYKVLQRPTTSTLIPLPEESINWNETENVFIEGENLEVLKILQKAYYGKVKMIYIDPPYNTGNDSFIYPDKFSETKEEYLKRTGDKDDDGYMTKEGMFRTNSKENGQYHSNWLNMMLPRLFLARNLLREDGSIFISIDDNEAYNLKLLTDEIFGEENFVASLSVKLNPRGRNLDKYVAKTHEYVLCYVKNYENENSISGLEKTGKMRAEYDKKDDNGPYRLIGLRNRNQSFNPTTRPTLFFPLFVNRDSGKVSLTGSEKTIEVLPETTEGVQTCWTWGKEKIVNECNKLIGIESANGWRVYRKDHLFDEDGFASKTLVKSMWDEKEINNDYGKKAIKSLFGSNVMSFPKSPYLMEKLVKIGSQKEDIILDFFAGSGTIAESIIRLNNKSDSNRKFICVQLPEIINDEKIKDEKNIETISILAHSRIVKVIEHEKARMNEELPLNKVNLGFRKFSLQDSNFKIWRGDRIKSEDDLKKQVELFGIPQRDGAEVENMLWELLIKSGIPLTENVTKIEVDKASIYHTESLQYAFVLEEYNTDVQKEVLKLKPKTVVSLDSLFNGNDNVKTNAQLKFEDNGISFKTV